MWGYKDAMVRKVLDWTGGTIAHLIVGAAINNRMSLPTRSAQHNDRAAWRFILELRAQQ
jgi:tetrahydromethanopterin S-methyltransferase subunit H